MAGGGGVGKEGREFEFSRPQAVIYSLDEQQGPTV